MNGFAFALSAAAFILATLALFLAARAATVAYACQQKGGGISPSQLQSLRNSVQEVEASVAELATSVRMMKTRRAGRMPDGKEASPNPDPYTNPDAWRAMMNATLSQASRKQ